MAEDPQGAALLFEKVVGRTPGSSLFQLHQMVVVVSWVLVLLVRFSRVQGEVAVLSPLRPRRFDVDQALNVSHRKIRIPNYQVADGRRSLSALELTR